MELLHPRRAYHRADTDDHVNQDAIELISMHSTKDPKFDYPDTFEYGPDYHLRGQDDDRRALVPVSQPSLRARWFSGWRTGAYSAALLALVSLIINIAAAGWLKRHPDAHTGLVEVFNGDCDKVSTMDLWVHLAINAISTLLLGGSNYCMQCLCSPTRKEIDKAHEKGQFLDIGVPSYRNLSSIAWPRVIMWWTLGLSSVPLHLMYNSAFYSSLAANDYMIYTVAPEFLDGGNATYNLTNLNYPFDYAGKGMETPELQQQIAANTTVTFDRLDPLACIKEYSQPFLSTRRNLVLVTTNSTKENTTVLNVDLYTFAENVDRAETSRVSPYDWICTSDPGINSKIVVPTSRNGDLAPCPNYVSEVETLADRGDWEPFGYKLDYCLSETVEQQCSFNGNLPIVIVVTVCNAIKAIVMLIVAYRLKGSPLITIGDALESFLTYPDSSTKGLCLLDRRRAALYAYVNPYRDANKKVGSWQWRGIEKMDAKTHVLRFKTIRWSSAASGRRWSITIGLILAALFTVIVLLGFGVTNILDQSGTIQDVGFGKVHESAVISGWSIDDIKDPANQIIAAIFIANMPQAILSFLYLNLNGLLTCMWTANEFSNFAKHRKYLRVSTPKGAQRSTHFLQLPYKVATPLMIASGLLHWLISQSIFLAVVAEYGPQDEVINAVQIASCGYSPLAMIAVLIVGTMLIVASVIVGRQKYDPSIPLAGSCSAAIAAACHRPEWDVDAGLQPVQWGVVPGSEGPNSAGHCCFTSSFVEPAREGVAYGQTTDGAENPFEDPVRKRKVSRHSEEWEQAPDLGLPPMGFGSNPYSKL